MFVFASARVSFGGDGEVLTLSLADEDMLSSQLNDGKVVLVRAEFVSSFE